MSNKMFLKKIKAFCELTEKKKSPILGKVIENCFHSISTYCEKKSLNRTALSKVSNQKS